MWILHEYWEQFYLWSQSIDWVPLDKNTPKIFGFSDFIAGLALTVLVWTISDVRYKFRLASSCLNLQNVTFWYTLILGFLVLATDLWRLEQWSVPSGNIITPVLWQALLGFFFFAMFLSWAYVGFVRPPIFGQMNCKRIFENTYKIINKGSPSELSVISDEIGRSAPNLIYHCNDYSQDRRGTKNSKVNMYADNMLRLIADRRFCNVMIESSSGTIFALFREISQSNKFDICVSELASSIVHEAIANKKSFLFVESLDFDSGLLGEQKPITKILFSNYTMVENIGSMLDLSVGTQQQMDPEQWSAYASMVLTTYRSYVTEGYVWQNSYVLNGSQRNLTRAASDLYRLDGVVGVSLDNSIIQKLKISVDFVKRSIAILEERDVPVGVEQNTDEISMTTAYDRVATMIYEIIRITSSVRSPARLSWFVQHNIVWGDLFILIDGPAAQVVQRKVGQLLYKEACWLGKHPNPKSACILGFCLNVFGIKAYHASDGTIHNKIKRDILTWVRKNYALLHKNSKNIAEQCLVDGFSFDVQNNRLVQIFPADNLRAKPRYVYYTLDSVQAAQDNELLV